MIRPMESQKPGGFFLPDGGQMRLAQRRFGVYVVLSKPDESLVTQYFEGV
jgi:hypothetical protein